MTDDTQDTLDPRPLWQTLAEYALDADDAYQEALPPQMRFVCGSCGRPPMAAAQRLRKESNEG